MEPIPETREAIGELDVLAYDDDLLDQLHAQASRVRELVPACVAMSLTMRDQGVTLTLVATGAEIAALDAMRHLDRGPRTAAVDQGADIASDAEFLEERRWELFAADSAAPGVACTLSLPLLAVNRGVLGGINLYADRVGSFEGHHEELADIFGAWAGGAVRNADLSFRTRSEAQQAPERLRATVRIDTAVGLLAARLHLSEELARDRIDAAAASTGLPSPALAQSLITLLTSHNK